jgi:SAM-dependent methyltransferase
MFFPEKITLIKPNDYVLEIGPGSTPHGRSDVFLELKYDNEREYEAQRGVPYRLKTEKPIFYYDGTNFPFKDGEFDYVICSHVIEHVNNIEFFVSEMFRVAPKGYLEYPTIYYEYLYNFSVHNNYIKFNKDCLIYLKKSKTGLNEFLPVQSLFFESLCKGYDSLVKELKQYMFEGFEYEKPFKIKEAKSIEDLIFNAVSSSNMKNREGYRINIPFFKVIRFLRKKAWSVL